MKSVLPMVRAQGTEFGMHELDPSDIVHLQIIFYDLYSHASSSTSC